ncbi:MAG: hydroxyacid-oxoacid transhydrogenase [Planctomycetales bacterium]
MSLDRAFQLATSNLRFGRGITHEVGQDLADLRVRRTLVLIDPHVHHTATGATVRQSLDDAGLEYEIYDRIRVEPTDVTFREAAKHAQTGDFDGFLAVGGGSTIDTAKAANLYSTYPPADFLDYINAPVGRGLPVPGPLKPLIAIPTTAGTGSETTGVAICDLADRHVKTGIAHRSLKPLLGIVDPENTRTQPGAVAASTGLDVLSHALESYTALPYDQRPAPERPSLRPAYQGSNPLSDIWALKALEIVAEYLPRAAKDPTDDEARWQMMLAASMAGMGFGNAGVHLPHGMSYPVAGKVKTFRPSGYETVHPLIPHGISVILNTPAVVRFTAPTSPERHLRGAAALGADVSRAHPADAGKILADRLLEIMQLLGVPNGLSAVGYTSADIPVLVEGTLPQHRVTKLSPRPAGPEDLAHLFEESLSLW